MKSWKVVGKADDKKKGMSVALSLEEPEKDSWLHRTLVRVYGWYLARKMLRQAEEAQLPEAARVVLERSRKMKYLVRRRRFGAGAFVTACMLLAMVLWAAWQCTDFSKMIFLAAGTVWGIHTVIRDWKTWMERRQAVEDLKAEHLVDEIHDR